MPRWVVTLFEVKLDDGEDLPVGTVVDLKKMKSMGEEILYPPVSGQGDAGRGGRNL